MPLFRKKCRTGPAFMLQNGPFSPKNRQIAFFKVNTGVSLPSSGRHKNGILGGFVGSHPGVCFSGRFRLYLETAPYYCRGNDKNGQKTTRRAWSRRSLSF